MICLEEIEILNDEVFLRIFTMNSTAVNFSDVTGGFPELPDFATMYVWFTYNVALLSSFVEGLLSDSFFQNFLYIWTAFWLLYIQNWVNKAMKNYLKGDERKKELKRKERNFQSLFAEIRLMRLSAAGLHEQIARAKVDISSPLEYISDSLYEIADRLERYPEDTTEDVAEEEPSEEFSSDPDEGEETFIPKDGTAYYMSPQARKRLKNPDCGWVCKYTTKTLNEGEECPKPAVYIHECGDGEVRHYCQQHYYNLSRRGGFETIYKKADCKTIPKQILRRLV